MQEPSLFELFVEPLHRAEIKYLVAGSLGSMFYGEPRLTLDIDLAVVLSSEELARFSAWFASPDYYCPPLELLAAENKRECRAHFNVIHVRTGWKADFYPSHADEFFTWAWDHKRSVEVAGRQVNYAPPEYIILWKVAYYREGGGEKHIRDIRRMLEISESEIDQERLDAELAKRGLLECFQAMLA